MTTFERIQYYYNKGLYTKVHLDTFLVKNVISPEEYRMILGTVETTEPEVEPETKAEE